MEAGVAAWARSPAVGGEDRTVIAPGVAGVAEAVHLQGHRAGDVLDGQVAGERAALAVPRHRGGDGGGLRVLLRAEGVRRAQVVVARLVTAVRAGHVMTALTLPSPGRSPISRTASTPVNRPRTLVSMKCRAGEPTRRVRGRSSRCRRRAVPRRRPRGARKWSCRSRRTGCRRSTRRPPPPCRGADRAPLVDLVVRQVERAGQVLLGVEPGGRAWPTRPPTSATRPRIGPDDRRRGGAQRGSTQPGVQVPAASWPAPVAARWARRAVSAGWGLSRCQRRECG